MTDLEKKEKLLPCPCCGNSDPTVDRALEMTGGSGTVRCSCGLMMYKWDENSYKAKANAIKAWNERVTHGVREVRKRSAKPFTRVQIPSVCPSVGSVAERKAFSRRIFRSKT